MSNPTNVFITESNVEMYLSKAYECLDGERRDLLLRLVVEEEDRMGDSREHVENGQRRLNECRGRIDRQRELLRSLQPNENRSRPEFMLKTCESILLLMEKHQRFLIQRFHHVRL